MLRILRSNLKFHYWPASAFDANHGHAEFTHPFDVSNHEAQLEIVAKCGKAIRVRQVATPSARQNRSRCDAVRQASTNSTIFKFTRPIDRDRGFSRTWLNHEAVIGKAITVHLWKKLGGAARARLHPSPITDSQVACMGDRSWRNSVLFLSHIFIRHRGAEGLPHQKRMKTERLAAPGIQELRTRAIT
jgi:hypothetical protein